MRPDRSLSFWRQVVALQAEAFAGVPDSALVERFTRRGDQEAFEEVTRRHGGMVWAVCRQMLARPADAEDAFQATFLAFVQSAGRVRGSVGAWLHGTAVRGALKTRRAAVRARQREQRTAKPEAAPEDSNWDELLAAVHEEVNRLPDALRTAFVTCDLEGVPQPDAAARLGWKPGTLTGRLSKARKRLLDALTQRGLAPALTGGALALGTATSSADVPAVLLTAVWKFPTAAPAAIPAALATLALEIAPMTIPKVKLLALAAMMSVGLAAGTGTVLVPMAGGQVPGGAVPGVGVPAMPVERPTDKERAELDRIKDELARLQQAEAEQRVAATKQQDVAEQLKKQAEAVNRFMATSVIPPPVDYKYVPKRLVENPLPLATYQKLIDTQTQQGWELAGSFEAMLSEKQYEAMNGMSESFTTLASYKPNLPCTVFVFKKAILAKPAEPKSTATAPLPTLPRPPRPVDPRSVAEFSGETVVCETAFTVTEQIAGNRVTTSYAVGDTIIPRHVQYASNVRRVKKGTPVITPPTLPQAEPTAVIQVKPQNMTAQDVVRVFRPLVMNCSLDADISDTIVTLKGGKQVVEATIQLIAALDSSAARSKPKPPTPTPAGGFNPLSLLGVGGDTPMLAADAKAALEPAVIQLHAIDSVTAVQLANELLPKPVKAIPIPGSSMILLINATPEHVAVLKKVLGLIDTPPQPPADRTDDSSWMWVPENGKYKRVRKPAAPAEGLPSENKPIVPELPSISPPKGTPLPPTSLPEATPLSPIGRPEPLPATPPPVPLLPTLPPQPIPD